MTDFDTIIWKRRTARKYLPESMPAEDIRSIVEAAQNAPLAAGDDRTSHLTVVTDPGLVEEIREAVMTESRKTPGKMIDPLHGAKVIVFFSATDISEDHIEFANAGCVIENMLLKATELGYGSAYTWGCLPKLRARGDLVKRLHLPEGYQILSAVVLGYSAKEAVVREKTEKIATNWV